MTSGKRILCLCGDYMEDFEIMVPYQALEAFGFHVDTVCPEKAAGDICKTAIHDFEGEQTYSEKVGHNFKLNASFNEINVETYDALLIPGGRAPEYLALRQDVLEVVRHFSAQNKPIASICHGQLILTAAGVVKGKSCTAYPALQPVMEIAGSSWIKPEPISLAHTDGNLVTAAAWPGHPEFVRQFAALLGATFSNNQKRILIIGGDYMEDYEIMVPFQTLLAFGYEVDAVCPDKGKGDICRTAIHDFEGDDTYTEKRGHNFILTSAFPSPSDALSNYDGLLLPGGRAPEYLALNDDVTKIATSFMEANKPVASICHGQLILAATKTMEGRKCTAYPTLKPVVETSGAEWIKAEPVSMAHTDGNLVTAIAWPGHPEFLAQFIKALGGNIQIA